jgi:hypothetical protein
MQNNGKAVVFRFSQQALHSVRLPNIAPLHGIYDVHPTGGIPPLKKKYTTLKPVSSKRLGRGPWRRGRPLSDVFFSRTLHAFYSCATFASARESMQTKSMLLHKEDE